MNETQIRSEFELTESESNILQYYNTGNITALKNYSGNSAYFDPVDEIDNQKYGGLSVWRVWFLAPREIYYSKSPNKHRLC